MQSFLVRYCFAAIESLKDKILCNILGARGLSLLTYR